MRKVRKKLWPKWFEVMKKRMRNVELRLADFRVKPGDILILEEWDPKKKKYTGRMLRKKVKRVIKINLLDFYTIKELKKHGCYLIEF